jgi:hypothetical protein
MNKNYKIIEEFDAFDLEGTTDYKVKKTNKVRTKKMFTLIPLWLNKFSWFQHIIVKERMYIVQKKEFEEYNYTFYWTKPYEEWRIEKIIK